MFLITDKYRTVIVINIYSSPVAIYIIISVIRYYIFFIFDIVNTWKCVGINTQL